MTAQLSAPDRNPVQRGPLGGAAPAPAASERQRRSRPRLWDTDWLVLRGMRTAIQVIADRIASPGKFALDFGCGAKPYQQVFTDRGATYVGADLGNEHEVQIRPDGTLSAADQSVDVLVSFQVLEHVRDIDTYLREARRVLRHDGLMLLSTHGTWLYHPHPQDHRRWTREGLAVELTERDFEVVECVPVVGPLAWTTIIRLTCIAVAVRRVPFVGNGLAAIVAVVMNLKASAEDWITPAWVTKDNACVYVTLSRRSQSEPR